MNCNTPCSICPNRDNPKKIVKCDGDLDARVLFIGEKPNINEDYHSRPFVGRAGVEFNKMYLPIAGLYRGNVMLTNAVRCFDVNGGAPATPEQSAICSSHHLSLLLPQMHNLSVVVPMGAAAYSLVRNSNRDIEVQHGIPMQGTLDGRSAYTLPMIHPSAGLHKPNYIQQCREDFRVLRDILNKGRWLPVDDYKDKEDYAELLLGTEKWDQVLYGLECADSVAIDTETENGEPWCLTFSYTAGTGYMIKVNDPGLSAFSAALQGKRIVLHNALYDYPVLRKMGIDIRWDQVHDTMIEAYNRCMPQGLKKLAYRLHYMEMDDYSDVVKPYAEEAMLSYIEEAAFFLERQDMVMGYLLGLAKYLEVPATYKSPKVQEKHDTRWGQTLDRMGMSYEESQQAIQDIMYLNSYYPWHEKGTITPYKKLEGLMRKEEDYEKRFDKLPAYVMDRVLALCGDKPNTGISQVPYDKAVWYACRDADATLRIDIEFRVMPDEPEVV